MKKVTELSVRNFYANEKFKMSNTQVVYQNGKCIFQIFGNTIAIRDFNGIWITNCGYRTATTKERLNGIIERFGLRISQKSGSWLINGADFDEQLEDGIYVNEILEKLEK